MKYSTNMKTLRGILNSPFIIMGLMLIISAGCKKSSSTIPASGQTMTDTDGNVYPVVTIGTQTWMAANLKTTHYRNGHAITPVSDSLQWSTLATEGFCDPLNNAAMVSVYGLFYNWYAVTDANNIAPAGWHVPTDAEWATLTSYLGTGGGGKLKTTGFTYWSSPNAGATNSTGFSALPAGDRSYTGLFHYMGTYGCWWCSNESDATNAWEHVVSCNSANITRVAYPKGIGLSIRCIKD